MSDIDQGTDARSEEGLAPAVTASTQPPAAAPPWPEIDGSLFAPASSQARRLAVPAFPLALLGEPWREWARGAARSANAPVDYVAQALLASVACLAGRHVMVIPASGWQEPSRLWLAAVGASGTGKSPALATVARLLWTLEEEQTGDPSRPRRRLVMRDGSFDRIVSALAEDPRGQLLWRDGPAGCLAPLDRGRTVRHLESRAPTILGTIAPDDVPASRSIESDSVVSRFLYAWPQPLPFRPLAGRAGRPGDEVLAPMRRLLHVFGELKAPHGLYLEVAAARAFDAFRARLHDEMREAEGSEAAWLGKGAGAVACLAGTLAVMAWATSTAADLPTRIDLDSTGRAVSLWSDYYRPHARAFLRRAAPGDHAEDIGRVVRWLRAGGRDTLTRTDIRRSALGRSVDADEADQVIAQLVEAGVLRPQPHVPTGRAGRPPLRWSVNPSLGTSSSLGARHASGAIISRLDKDARLESRAPSGEATRVHASANCTNVANHRTH